MRIQLVIEKKEGIQIPLNYNDMLSSLIKKNIEEICPDLMSLMIRKDQQSNNKYFRYFSFSNIKFDKYKIANKTIIWTGKYAEFSICFYLPDDMVYHVYKCFETRQNLFLGNSETNIYFDIIKIKLEENLHLTSEAVFECITPICISTRINSTDQISTSYLHPDNEKYSELFFCHMKKKYTSGYKQYYCQPFISDINNHHFNLIFLSKPKRKNFIIKENSKIETTVCGYLFDFKIIAPKEIIELGYNAGFGEKTSQGFGFVVNKKNHHTI